MVRMLKPMPKPSARLARGLFVGLGLSLLLGLPERRRHFPPVLKKNRGALHNPREFLDVFLRRGLLAGVGEHIWWVGGQMIGPGN